MNRSININQILTLFIALFVVTAFSACSDVAGPDNASDITSSVFQDEYNIRGASSGGLSEQELVCSTTGSSILKASKKSYNAGSVEYKIEDGNLIVTYVPAEGVTISEVHLWVGTDIEQMPSAGNGAPKNGHFPYTNITETIPLESIEGYTSGSPIIIVAHAVVQGSKTATFSKEETAYAGDRHDNNGRWFNYITWIPEEICVRPDGIISSSTE